MDGEISVRFFPPFNLIGRILRKLVSDQGKILLVFPFWPTQPWFPLVADLLIALPVVLPSSLTLLSCPGRPDLQHPLLPSLRLIVGLLSPDVCRLRKVRNKLSKSSFPAGNQPQPGTTPLRSGNGFGFATNSSWSPATLL